MNRLVIVLLTLINFGLLIPGVTMDIYSVEINTLVEAEIIADPVNVTVYQQTRSIMSTIRELWLSADYLVSFLILLFSVIVPVTKGSMLLASIFVAGETLKKWLVLLVDLIGKWSMAERLRRRCAPGVSGHARSGAGRTCSPCRSCCARSKSGMETHLTSTLGPGFYYTPGLLPVLDLLDSGVEASRASLIVGTRSGGPRFRQGLSAFSSMRAPVSRFSMP